MKKKRVPRTEITPAHLCCMRSLRLIASPKKEFHLPSFYKYRDASCVKMGDYLPALEHFGYISVAGDMIHILK